MKIVAPFGFYGWGNIGDEATLQGFARLVELHDRRTRVYVASRNRAHTARVEPFFRYHAARGRSVRRRWAHWRAAAAVVAGGTPIQDAFGEWPLKEVDSYVTDAVRRGRPFAFVGCGTERLRRPESKELIAQRLAPHVVHWTVRSSRDLDRLAEYGVPSDRITVAADMAWLLRPVTNEFGRRLLTSLGVDLRGPVIGVNVNIEKDMKERQPQLLRIVAEALDALIERNGAHVIFLCNEIRDDDIFDLAASREIRSSMRRAGRTTLVPNEYWTPQEMLSLIACCGLTVTSRYHFAVFSALQGVPFTVLKRSSKVEDLCRDLAWAHGFELEGLEASRLLAAAEEIDQRRDALMDGVRARVEALRVQARTNTVALDALQEHLK